MANENERDYFEWLYNRYVEAFRKKEYQHTTIYYDALERFVWMMPKTGKYSGQHRYAKQFLKIITDANRNGTVGKLQLSGQEFTREYERVISEYRKTLTDEGWGEETVNYLVSIKQESYGND